MAIDLLIEGAKVFNTFLKQFEIKNIAIHDGKFYYISADDLRHLEPDTILDASQQFIIPGLIDIHMHIESSMVPPSTFSGAALANGVTTVVADPHEIANTMGIDGIYRFMEQETVLDIYYAIPSSVPSTTQALETTGGFIGVDEVRQLLNHPKVIALGEAMNFKGIRHQPDSLIRQIIKTVQALAPQMPLEGHIPRLSGEDLAQFQYTGLNADHTHQSSESIIDKVSQGIFVELQRKSLTPETIKTIVDHGFYEHLALITDDIMADDLFTTGHLNVNVKLAMELGLPAVEAIYMSTYTPARRMHLIDRGAIASGLKADFIILDNLASFTINQVFKNGQCVHRPGSDYNYDSNAATFPPSYYQSVQQANILPEDLIIAHDSQSSTALCNVIQIQAVGTFTEPVVREVPVKDGCLDWESSGLALILVKERYGKNGNIGYGLVEGALSHAGAIATTWAHDHHNLLVMGTRAQDILIASAEVIATQGGYAVSQEGQLQASCPLPIAGILSDQPLDIIGLQLQQVRQAMVNLGYTNTNEIMSFSTLSLPVSPKLKITDYGMIDVHTHEHIPLIRKED